LFVPKLDNLYKIWMTVMTKEDFAEKYGMEVCHVSELPAYLKDNCTDVSTTVYVNEGVNSDSGLTTDTPNQEHLEGLSVDRRVMHDILVESRVLKNDEEIFVMRWASQITTEAHISVM